MCLLCGRIRMHACAGASWKICKNEIYWMKLHCSNRPSRFLVRLPHGFAELQYVRVTTKKTVRYFFLRGNINLGGNRIKRLIVLVRVHLIYGAVNADIHFNALDPNCRSYFAWEVSFLQAVEPFLWLQIETQRKKKDRLNAVLIKSRRKAAEELIFYCCVCVCTCWLNRASFGCWQCVTYYVCCMLCKCCTIFHEEKRFEPIYMCIYNLRNRCFHLDCLSSHWIEYSSEYVRIGICIVVAKCAEHKCYSYIWHIWLKSIDPSNSFSHSLFSFPCRSSASLSHVMPVWKVRLRWK